MINREYKDICSRKQIMLPEPKFVVFYNGTSKRPEKEILSLSDSFVRKDKNVEPSLECKALVLNINYGYNNEIMDRCSKLKEYAYFIKTVREKEKKYKKTLTIEQIVNLAVKY